MKSCARGQNRKSHICLLWLLGWLYVAVMFSVPAAALDPARRLTQYGHTAWRIQDGFFTGTPYAITQTKDGYLWVGTTAGLLRFDGVRFVPWSPPQGQQLFSNTITSLLGSSDGSLWIGTAAGLERWHNGSLTAYENARGHINVILQDRQGGIWTTRTRIRDGTGPLCKAGATTLHCYGAAEGISFPYAAALAADLEGNLWIGSPTGFARWTPVSSSTIKPEALRVADGLVGVASIVTAEDGSMLIGMSRDGPGLGLERWSQGKLKPFLAPGLDGSTLHVSDLLADRDHTLWIATMSSGIYHVGKDRAEHFTSAQGLSSDSTAAMYQDHEGDLWVATSRGIDEFRDLNVATWSTAEGINSDVVMSIVAAADGTVYAGNNVLDQIRDGHVVPIGQAQGLPGQEVTSLLEDHTGRLWLGVDGRLAIYENHGFSSVIKPDGSQVGVVVSMTEDAGGNIWALSIGHPQKLARIRNRKVVEDLALSQDPIAIAADPQDGIWLALSNGDLAQYRGQRLQDFPVPPSPPKHQIQQLIVNADDSVLGVTSAGLVGLRNGKVQKMTSRNGLSCDTLDGLVMDAKGSLWLHAECGLMEISKSDLENWWKNPEAALKVATFDVLDGYLSGPSPFRPNASRAPDGKLWFANGSFAQMIDPSNLVRNTIPPPVHVEAVIADRKRYSLDGYISLPPHTRDLEIDFTALSLVAPQKVRFRYRLDGRDDSWHDSGNRRQAFYTDLRPGSYQFRVQACNNDGLWNDSDESLSFMMQAAFYQTGWFRLLCASLAIAVLWLAYFLRLRHATAQVRERLGARVEERERIARELHDTLLQGFQGLMLRFQAVLKRIPDAESAHQMMEKALERADEVLLEGRERVRDLRDEGEITNDLAEDLVRYGKEQAEYDHILFTLAVLGAPQLVIPRVRNEAYRIGREALANAFHHASASTVEVEITYGLTAFSLRIRDDGKGIDQDILNAGRTGHWGLSGMRERALKISGRLNIWSDVNRGTEIDLTVPAKVAYPRSQDYSVWQRMKRAFGEMGG